MNDENKEASVELMREAGIGVVEGAGAIASQGRVDIAQITKELEQKMVLIDRIHSIIHSKINVDTDIKKFGDKWRRTINFARKCYRIVGGSITWQTYPSGLKYLRETMQDEGGSWFAISVSCIYKTPWGETVESFKRITSRDPFLGEREDDEGPQDVNEQNIVEKAVTEAFKGAIFTALGMPKDITATEMQKFGINGEKATGHSFEGAKGAQGGSVDTNQESYDQRKQIELMCKTLADSGWNGCATAVDVLKESTKNTDKGWNGWTNFKAIKETQLPRIHSYLTKLVEESTTGSK